ncbi:hypothetical protein CapIbe_012606 [Capra ibex]
MGWLTQCIRQKSCFTLSILDVVREDEPPESRTSFVEDKRQGDPLRGRTRSVEDRGQGPVPRGRSSARCHVMGR